MDDPYLYLVIILIVLLCFSAFFSAVETAFSSVNKIRIKNIAKANDKLSKKARKVYQISHNFNQILATVLISNNIVNIIITSLTTYLFVTIFNLGRSGLLLSTIVVSFVIIVFAELVPKTLAKRYSEKFAIFSVNIVEFLILIFWPITFLVSLFNKPKRNAEVTATEDELIEIIQTIEHEGVIEQSKSELIQSAISFDEIKVSEVMRKFEQVIFVEDNASFDDLLNILLTHKYTRIPVIDHITKQPVAIISEHDILTKVLRGNKETIELKDLYRKFVRAFENQSLSNILEKLQREKMHMAIVMDRFNRNIKGIVTLEDLIEEIVGEIYDEFDDTGNIVEIGHHIFHVKALATIYDLFTIHLEHNTVFPTTRHKFLVDWVRELNPKLEVNKVIVYDNLKIRILKIKDNKVLEVEINEMTKQEDLLED